MQCPHSVLDIPRDAFERRLPPDITHAFLDTRGANESQFESRRATGLVAAHPAAHPLVDGNLQERLQFAIQFFVCHPSPEKATDAIQEPKEQAHVTPPYSALKAMTGSTRAARRAGKNPATIATSVSIATAPMIATGSSGVIP